MNLPIKQDHTDSTEYLIKNFYFITTLLFDIFKICLGVIFAESNYTPLITIYYSYFLLKLLEPNFHFIAPIDTQGL